MAQLTPIGVPGFRALTERISMALATTSQPARPAWRMCICLG
jgi:hypothetical protein